MPWSGPGQVNMKRKGLFAAFILGLVFGIALGPCTIADMAPMLGVTFKLAESNPVYGASLLLAYGVGHCSVIILAGTFTEVVQRFLNWNEQSKGVTVVKRVCGVLVLLGGVWLMIYPMMLKVDFSAIGGIARRPKGLLVTLFVNSLIKPFSMALLAWIFIQHVFAAWIGPEMAKQYTAGLIILAAAPCTDMVFVWSYLTDGDPAYTLVQVAVNDLIMLVALGEARS